MALKNKEVTVTFKVDAKDLGKVNKQLKQFGTEAKKVSTQSQKGFSSMLNTFKGLAGPLGIALGTAELINFGKEAVKLAAKGEGIRTAFSRLNDPNLFKNLKEATQGTVSDLDLMARAVSAKNLGVPIEQLGKLFQFARRRASETGESVDFLVNSIVTGIGRKSPLILDNLGINTRRLSKEFQRTGDFVQAVGNIVDEELTNMGDDIDTTANKLSRFQAGWSNLQELLGKQLIGAFEDLGDVAEVTVDIFDLGATAIKDISTSIKNFFTPAINEASDGVDNFQEKVNGFVGGVNILDPRQVVEINNLLEETDKITEGLVELQIEGQKSTEENNKSFRERVKDLRQGLLLLTEQEKAVFNAEVFQLKQNAALERANALRNISSDSELESTERALDRNEAIQQLIALEQKLNDIKTRTNEEDKARTVEVIRGEIKAAQQSIENLSTREDIVIVQEQINALTEELNALLNSQGVAGSLKAYQEELKKLQEQQAEVNAESAEYGLLGNEIARIQEKIAAIIADREVPALKDKAAALKEINDLTGPDADFLDPAPVVEFEQEMTKLGETLRLLGAGFGEAAPQILNNIQAIAGQTADLINAVGDKQIQKLQEDNEERLAELDNFTEQSQERLQFQLDNRLITEAEFENQLTENKKQQEEQRLMLEKKKAEEIAKIRKRQATADKIAAIFGIGINTATAVVGALAPPPVGLGPVAGVPLAATVGALGALQIATVAATPIPKFAKGTKGAPGGASIVGEQGEEMVFLPQGAKVVPNDRTRKYSGVVDSMIDNNLDQYLIKEYIPQNLFKKGSEGTINNIMLRTEKLEEQIGRLMSEGMPITNIDKFADAIDDRIGERFFVKDNSY